MSVLQRVYNDYLREYTESVGLHPYAVRSYVNTKRMTKLFIGDHPRAKTRIQHLLSSKKSVTHDINGVTVEFPIEEHWQYRRFKRMHSERELFEDLIEELAPGDVFYDIGAHLGWHTVVTGSIDESIDIVSFEPHPITASRLESVLEFTGHEADVYQVALHQQEGTFEITKHPVSGARVSEASRAIETVAVNAIDGDTLITRKRVQPPDVLKIDAEGAEAEVLRGLRETIRSHRPRLIYCEIHEAGMEVKELLNELGYEWTPFNTGRPIVKASVK